MAEAKAVRHDWRDIFRAFKMAFDPKKIFLGYAGLLASLVWCVIVLAFFSAVKLISINSYTFVRLIFRSAGEGISAAVKNFLSAITPLDFSELFVFAILVFGVLAIWSFVGGAITRISSLDYARDESVRLIDALKFARRKFWSYFWSPLVPIIGVFFFGLCNVFAGLIGRIPVFGEIFIALSFPLALISGFFMAFIGVIGVLGLCLMFPTISAEGSDAFDAMSRAYSYVLSRPKEFVLYYIIKIVYGLVCLAFVAFAAWLMIRLSFYTIGLGMGQKFSVIESFISQKCNFGYLGFCSMHSHDEKVMAGSLNWSLQFLSGMLIVYIVFVKLVVWTFVTTYLFSAKTIVYLLLRNEIDSTDIADIYLEEVDERSPLSEGGGN
ncbi:MAG: hypothetical protein E3K32_05040 [wastewater metagenome]|nr:hypothetical protein [Candidatus Loosdrechtia aerotolerans]